MRDERKQCDPHEKYVANIPISPKRPSMKLKEDIPMPAMPTAPTLNDIESDTKLTLNVHGRHHAFSNKTFVRRDTCAHCLKR